MKPLIPHTKWERNKKMDFQISHRPFQSAIDVGNDKGFDFTNFSQDMFSSLYQYKPEFPGESAEQSGTAWAKKALDELQGLPEFKNARSKGTVCDSFQSGLGASILTKHFAESLPKMETPNPDTLNQRIEALQDYIDEFGEDSEKGQRANQKLLDTLQQTDRSIQEWGQMADNMDAGAVRQCFRRGLVELDETINKIEDAANAFGYGREPGHDGYSNSELKMRVAETVQNNPKLLRIAELAGRFKREARKVQANKKRPGPDEVSDIEVGADIARIVPAEMMKLGDEMTEPMFMKQYLERSLVQYKLTRKIKESKGPMVILLDNSSSMQGEREVWSKALSLAICRVAIDQNRDFVLIHYAGEVKRTDIFNTKSVDPEKLLESISYFSGGGTNTKIALMKAIITIETQKVFKKADIILLSDGIDSIYPIDELIKAKQKLEARIFTILLETAFVTGSGIPELSDELLTIADLAEKGADKNAKEIVFSI